MRRWQSVIDDTGSEEAIYAFIHCTKWRFGRVSRMPDRLTTLKDRATQLLIKYKSGALVTQFLNMVGKVQIWPSKAYFFGENHILDLYVGCV